ncbi:MAG: Na/Pi cotransporter family protein [Alphaproteobacteria bacterium]|jgi:phosphate:Na+ symporter|nr:Na/Pi cotransporter family protein [Alphaproteobacteria bacterium]MDP6566134.1 Na/Pi cotransporter family protein [Alphaproteobacteria bacterium]MDP6813792.1 Na/Pi cotransporter family protein [Alphaproteobacteria bacterium]
MSGTAILINLLGGVALLLWGLRMVRTGVTRSFGGDLQRLLGHSLRNRFTAFAAGLGATVVLQSSTATSLLAASFAGRHLMATAPALAILLGADVGTSLVAQILTFDLSLLSPILLLAGLIIFHSVSGGRRRNIGRICLGLGLILLALRLIVSTSEPLRDSALAQQILASLTDEAVIAVLVGALIAWLSHSSLATVLLIMSLAAGQVIAVGAALALVLGANLGAAAPPIVATLRSGVVARRPPLGNLLFRLVGCLLALPFLAEALPWLALLETDAARQVANFHTAFNLCLAILFLPLIGPMARLTEAVLPEATEADDVTRPRHLDAAALDTPAVALANVRREVVRMGEVVEQMLSQGFEALRNNDKALAKKVEKADDVVDGFHAAIRQYLTLLSREPLGDQDSRRCADLLMFTTNLEHVGDIIELNVVESARKKTQAQIQFSNEDLAELTALFELVRDSMRICFAVFMSDDITVARQLIERKTLFRRREMAAIEEHQQRLRAAATDGVEASSIFLDVLRDLRRINSHLTSAAYPILDTAGELRPNRLRSHHGPS